MPNYKYKCCKCKKNKIFTLPISTDPKKMMSCDCGYIMKRAIIVSQFPEKVGKVWADDWYKKTYGHGLGERDKSYASEQAALDKEVKELKSEYGISVNAESKEKEC